jgi:hypothetical protein
VLLNLSFGLPTEEGLFPTEMLEKAAKPQTCAMPEEARRKHLPTP